jgi:type II secretory pathway pseudopilin PulG
MQPGAPPVSAPPPRGPGTPNLTGYATVMPEMQQRQVMEQAQAQAAAAAQQQQQQQQQQQGAMKPVVGLAGIGLAGHMDVHKVAAAKMQQQQQQALQQQLQAQQQAQQQHMGNHMGGQGQRIAPAVNGAVNSPRPIQAAPAPSPSPVPVPVPVAQPPGQTPQAVGGQGGQ